MDISKRDRAMALNIQRRPGTVGKSSGDAKNKRSSTPQTALPRPEQALFHPDSEKKMKVDVAAVTNRKAWQSTSSDIRKCIKPTGATASVEFKSSVKKVYKGPPVARVVNTRKAELNKRGVKDLEQWVKNSNNVYIGRNMTCYVKGAVGSKWHNPFKPKKLGREEAVKRYEEYVRANPSLMAELDELKGKCLGCWCHPLSCHGHVLVRLLEEKIRNEGLKKV